MNCEGGYTRHFRRMWQNPAFRSKQEAAVFAWMIDAAQWREHRMSTRFGPVTLKPGELLISERELAEDFGMHRNTLRALLQRMADEGIIERFLDRTPHRAGTIVSIKNYAAYQGVEAVKPDTQDRNGTADGTEAGPKRDRSGTKNNEEKEGKEGEGHDSVPPQLPLLSAEAPSQTPSRSIAKHGADDPEGFAEFYRVFPLKKDRKGARGAWPAAVRKVKGDWKVLVTAAEAYAREVAGRDPQHIKYPQGWLNGERWLDQPAPLSEVPGTVLPFPREGRSQGKQRPLQEWIGAYKAEGML